MPLSVISQKLLRFDLELVIIVQLVLEQHLPPVLYISICQGYRALIFRHHFSHGQSAPVTFEYSLSQRHQF